MIYLKRFLYFILGILAVIIWLPVTFVVMTLALISIPFCYIIYGGNFEDRFFTCLYMGCNFCTDTYWAAFNAWFKPDK